MSGTTTPELWGPGDLRKALGAKSSRTLSLWRARPDFPAPIATVCEGTIPIWDAATVRTWHATRGRTRATNAREER